MKMQKFKYSIQRIKTSPSLPILEKAVDLLNDMGSQGWELVAVTAVEDANEESMFYFKRPVEN
jgi:hypothetical protein